MAGGSADAAGAAPHPAARPAATPAFKVLAFYDSDENDAAHASFDNEAKQWFPQVAAANNFSWTATDDWSKVNASTLSQYQVVMFLDDLPQTSAEQTAFQQYMDNGGGWMGFHVSAFNTDPSTWSWYHNTFLGTGAFVSNSWGPTSVTLKVEDPSTPATAGLPATIGSSVSEWYSWANDLRKNPDIDILASIDPSSFPVGTDPDQTWYSGYYPIVWTNKNYRMMYANFGHNAMDYTDNTTLSLTFGSAQQDQLVLQELLSLGGDSAAPAPMPAYSSSAWYSLSSAASLKCADARSAATANGTAVQQYTCNGTDAQQFQLQPTSDGYVRVNDRADSSEVLDVTDVSTADGAPIQLWDYSDGTNQQWKPVAENSWTYHFVNRNSGKCLSAASDSTADSVQLVQATCDGSTLQSFRLQPAA
ncbi:ThuA domain-containing protein [Streptomyces sp. SL13]|uniref:ThuA domain-containing protein n=1 Tax=Streptantibioticus silvisoli TaxID=2705255 RepID=A0AA90H258_9ACTN|nr:ThuA domain-containing protein [Streptantibioticus silvisoli]MDI5962241.1 ThuA domain-containing protein [Streptantibioticus silvisoli]MDI5970671.1 ThuA domain-containing protein [Streptantibioticus silvisoli]